MKPINPHARNRIALLLFAIALLLAAFYWWAKGF